MFPFIVNWFLNDDNVQEILAKIEDLNDQLQVKWVVFNIHSHVVRYSPIYIVVQKATDDEDYDTAANIYDDLQKSNDILDSVSWYNRLLPYIYVSCLHQLTFR